MDLTDDPKAQQGTPESAPAMPEDVVTSTGEQAPAQEAGGTLLGAGDGNEEKPSDGTEGAAEKPPVDVPETPEGYEFQVPEGVQIDEELAGRFRPLAHALGLSRGQAQKFVEMYAEHAREQMAHADKTRQEWENQVRADPEIGGKHLDETIQVSRRVIDRYGDKEVLGLFHATGLGSHPSIIRMLNKIGRATGEAKFDGGAPPVRGPMSHLDFVQEAFNRAEKA